jgi:hypothetical protein
MATTTKFPFKTDNSITKEFAKYAGKPNSTRNKRALVKSSNPHHYAFGDVRPVWKTWQSYAQNMQLLEADYEN